MLCRFRFFRFF